MTTNLSKSIRARLMQDDKVRIHIRLSERYLRCVCSTGDYNCSDVEVLIFFVYPENCLSEAATLFDRLGTDYAALSFWNGTSQLVWEFFNDSELARSARAILPPETEAMQPSTSTEKAIRKLLK